MKLKSVRAIKVTTHKSGLKCVKIARSGIYKTIYGRTIAEVRKKYAIFKNQIEYKTPERTSYTFLEWYEKWLQLYKKDIKENTLKAIKGIFNKYFLSKIGNKPLKAIRSDTLQTIFNGIQAQHPRQCTVAYLQLKACFEQAYKLNYISHNPCYAISIKKNKGEKGKGLTKEQQQKLLKYMNNHPNKINNLILIYLNTGIRCSELLSIEQEDIDRVKNELHIKGTKTITSNRIIQTNKEVIDLIPTSKHPFKEWNKDKIEREFKKITKALNFNKIGIHSLRHTFATNCIESGVDMVVLQKWLGHASITMTIDRYTHISEEYKQENLQKVKAITLKGD